MTCDLPLSPAGLDRRGVAWIIDSALLGCVVFPFALIAGDIWTITLVLSVVVPLAYGVAGDALGATGGKAVLNLRVVDARTGKSIGFKRAVVRRAIYYLGAAVFFLGWARAFGEPCNRAWHDSAAGTLVVGTRSL